MAFNHLIRRAWEKIADLLFHWITVGLVLVATGFTPDHWIEELDDFLRDKGLPLLRLPIPDPRLIVVTIGIAIIVISVLRRRRAKGQPEHAAIVEAPPAQPLPVFELRVFRDDLATREAVARLGASLREDPVNPAPPIITVAAEPGEEAAVLPRAPHCVGRDDLLDQLVGALCGPTPVSCLVRGNAGIGKTTLTLAAANNRKVARRYGAHRWFVKLDTAPDTTSLQTAVVAALGLDPASSRFADALAQLGRQPGLLILDNLETPWENPNETEAVENSLDQIASIAGVALLASIRGVASPHLPHWDHRFEVIPLEAPDATRIFRRIATNIRPDDPHLPLLLGELGGVPLAIELVAFRAESETTLAELWQEWQRLGTELAARPASQASRLTSLPNSIELSLRSPRLGDDGKRLFRLLGQLPAGIAREDRTELLGDSAVTAAEELRAVGLAMARGERLDLLPPVRGHARRHYSLDDTEMAAWRDHYLALLSDLGGQIGRPGGAEAAARLTPEWANLEAALSSLLASRVTPDTGFTLGGLRNLMVHTGVGSPAVIARWAELCHDLDDAYGEARCREDLADVMEARSQIEEAVGGYGTALAIYERLGNTSKQAWCIYCLGNIALARSDYDAARGSYERAQSLYHQDGDVLGEANCIQKLGDLALERSDHDQANNAYEQALPLYRRVGAILGEASCIKGVGDIALSRFDYDRARDAYERAAPLYRQVGNILGEANCTKGLADIALARPDHDAARDAYERALSIYRQVGNVVGEANCIQRLGDISLARPDYGAARDAYERALLLYRQVGNILGEANCIFGLGDVANGLSDRDGAASRFREALAIYERALLSYSVGRTHWALSRVTTSEERQGHLAAARAAWLSVDRADLVAQFLPSET